MKKRVRRATNARPDARARGWTDRRAFTLMLLGLLPSIGLVMGSVGFWIADGERQDAISENRALFEQERNIAAITLQLFTVDAAMHAAAADPEDPVLGEIAAVERDRTIATLNEALSDSERIAADISKIVDQNPEEFQKLVEFGFGTAVEQLEQRDPGEPATLLWNAAIPAAANAMRDALVASSSDAAPLGALFDASLHDGQLAYVVSMARERSSLIGAQSGTAVAAATAEREAAWQRWKAASRVDGLIRSPFDAARGIALAEADVDPAAAYVESLLDGPGAAGFSSMFVDNVELGEEVFESAAMSYETVLAAYDDEFAQLASRRRLVAVLAVSMTAVSLLLVAVTRGEVRHRRRVEDAHSTAIAALDEESRHDPMTGLRNRRDFEMMLEAAVAKPQSDGPLAVVYLDLDRFKALNDVWGHSIGDQVLQIVAKRLRSTVRGVRFEVVRFGGDEFVMYANIPGITVAGAAELAEVFIGRIEQPIVVGDSRYEISATCGVTVAIPDSTAESLLLEADSALIVGKQNRRGAASGYNRSLNRTTDLIRQLPTAFDNEEINAYFQPILTAKGELSHFEALARWRRADGGFVPPDEFVPLLESFGLEGRLTETILRCVSELVHHERFPEHVRVYLNVSPHELEIAGFVNRLILSVAELGLDPQRLGVEITETAAISDPLLLGAHLARLREAGIEVAIDDFGSGYSPLGILFDLPIDIVKLDRSLVSGVHRDQPRAALTAGLIEALHAHGIRIVAEGVEVIEEHLWLEARGVDYVQGFRYSKPVTARKVLDSEWKLRTRGDLAA